MMEGAPLKCIIVCKIASKNVAAVLGGPLPPAFISAYRLVGYLLLM